MTAPTSLAADLKPAVDAAVDPSVEVSLKDIKASADSDYPVAPGMPALGDRVLVEAVFGKICHPTMPDVKYEMDVGKITPVVFDWFHVNQWQAGRIKLASV